VIVKDNPASVVGLAELEAPSATRRQTYKLLTIEIDYPVLFAACRKQTILPQDDDLCLTARPWRYLEVSRRDAADCFDPQIVFATDGDEPVGYREDFAGSRPHGQGRRAKAIQFPMIDVYERSKRVPVMFRREHNAKGEVSEFSKLTGQ
jgi:hypothetical protein